MSDLDIVMAFELWDLILRKAIRPTKVMLRRIDKALAILAERDRQC